MFRRRRRRLTFVSGRAQFALCREVARRDALVVRAHEGRGGRSRQIEEFVRRIQIAIDAAQWNYSRLAGWRSRSNVLALSPGSQFRSSSVPSDSGQTDVPHEHDGTQLSANQGAGLAAPGIRNRVASRPCKITWCRLPTQPFAGIASATTSVQLQPKRPRLAPRTRLTV